ncbi:hypothetical protein R7J51_24585, partial [Acinetobacter baumannii]|nr:hypothetical protein [Acinetobacter baumannii]
SHREGFANMPCSWRHTPFRNVRNSDGEVTYGSWRHTPFRNSTYASIMGTICSWRHTPFRKSLSVTMA